MRLATFRATTLAVLGACTGGLTPPPRVPPTPTTRLTQLDPLARLLDSAVRAGAAPGGVVAVSFRGARYLYGTGRLALDDPTRPDGHSVYDLASLTKVVATTTLAMQAVRDKVIELDQPAVRYLPAFAGPGKERVTIRHLLTHSSGLRADRAIWRQSNTPDSGLRLMLTTPLDTAPAVRMLYSDVGAIVLGRLLERVLGGRLDRLAHTRIFKPLGMHDTRFRPPASWIPRIAATEYDTAWRKRIVRGEVHDEKAAWLRGVAGHAGLFGSAVDLLTFGEFLLAELRAGNPSLREFVRRQEVVPGSSRALGWDTKAPGNSAGTLLSDASFGHTGFTGTSFWVDPTRDLVVVLLTNRVHPTRSNDRIFPLRIAVADAVTGLLAPEMRR